jgi:Flp pilus assembly protein TadD
MTLASLNPTLVCPTIIRPTLIEIRRLYAAADFAAAAEAGWTLLRSDPYDAEVLNAVALIENARGNSRAGLVLLQRAVKAAPTNHALWNDLGNLYFTAGAMGEAEEAYRNALQFNNRCAEAYSNLAVICLKRCEHAEARALLERALAIRPQYSEALYNLGNALAGLGKFQKALRRYEQARDLNPQHPGTHFNLGITRLVMGDLDGGWPEWEWRWRSTLAPFKRDFAQPAWKGEELNGKRLLLYAEQGIGDTLQFLRYVSMVAVRGAQIVLEVQGSLLPLLQGYPQVAELVARGDELPDFDVQCSLMSLGAVFRTTLSTLPPAVLQFRALEEAPAREAPLLQAGFVWAGNPTHVRDAERSMPLEAFLPLLFVPGVQWFSLQKGNAAAQLTVDERFASVINLAAAFQDYADTAKALQALDLVITVDTSVAHLAGAMGKAVWILLPAIPDWRWLLKRRDSPWYPTARLFRQQEPGDWAGVIASVQVELESVALSGCRSESR